MNRGLTLKCLQCDSHEFHILYEMGPQPGGVPHLRQSGSYECVLCGYVAVTKRRERRWWQKSSRSVRPMNRERRTIQSPKHNASEIRP